LFIHARLAKLPRSNQKPLSATARLAVDLKAALDDLVLKGIYGVFDLEVEGGLCGVGSSSPLTLPLLIKSIEFNFKDAPRLT